MSKKCPNCGGDCYKNGRTAGNTPNYDCKTCWWASIVKIPLAPEDQGQNLSRGEARKRAFPNE